MGLICAAKFVLHGVLRHRHRILEEVTGNRTGAGDGTSLSLIRVKVGTALTEPASVDGAACPSSGQAASHGADVTCQDEPGVRSVARRER